MFTATHRRCPERQASSPENRQGLRPASVAATGAPSTQRRTEATIDEEFLHPAGLECVAHYELEWQDRRQQSGPASWLTVVDAQRTGWAHRGGLPVLVREAPSLAAIGDAHVLGEVQRGLADSKAVTQEAAKIGIQF
jgi:hypothetical protein